MSDAANDEPRRARRSVWSAAIGAVCAAVLFVVLTPAIGPWGDGLGILAALGDTSGANPRAYHVGYAVLARAAVASGQAFGLAPETAALGLSRLALALGAGLCVLTAAALGARPLAALGWTLVALASPSLLFFGGAVEVHAVQFLGSALALALVVRGRRCASIWLRGVVAVVAAALALVLHLSHLLLLPALFVLAVGERGSVRGSGSGSGGGAHGARGADADPRARRRDLAWLGVLALCVLGAATAVGCLVWFRAAAPGTPPPAGLARPAFYLGQYQQLFLEFKASFGWFGPIGMARHFAAEGLGQGGFVWLAGALALAFGRGRARFATAVLVVVYVLVVSQAGLRERGGYYVSVMPWFVALGAAATAGRGRAWCLVPWLVLPMQIWLGWSELARYAQRPDARSWARAVVEVVDEPCTVFTSDMVRLSALPLERDGFDGLQWNQQFEYTPRANWDRVLRVPYEQALVAALANGRVYLDPAIVGHGRAVHERAAWQRWAAGLLERPDVALEPVVRLAGERAGEALLLELVVADE